MDIMYAPALNFHDLQTLYQKNCWPSAVTSRDENLEVRLVLKNHNAQSFLVAAIRMLPKKRKKQNENFFDT